MKWKVSGVEDESIDEISLDKSDIESFEEEGALCRLDIENPDKELQKIVLFSDINSLIDEYVQNNDDIFFVDSKYYKDITLHHKNKGKFRIIFVYGSSKFEIESNNSDLVIYVPNTEFQEIGVYF